MHVPTAMSINVTGRLTRPKRKGEKKDVYRNFHAPAAERSLNCRRIRSWTFILNFRRNEPGIKERMEGKRREDGTMADFPSTTSVLQGM